MRALPIFCDWVESESVGLWESDWQHWLKVKIQVLLIIRHTNDETVEVVDIIDSYSDSGEVSNCDMEYSDFVLDDEDITNLHEE